MITKFEKYFISFIFILIVLPFLIYFSKFYNTTLSADHDNWSKFGEYLNGIFSPLIALIGFFITIYIDKISTKRNENNLLIDQQKHRPIIDYSILDEEDHIKISIKNKGEGPLIINENYLINNNIDVHDYQNRYTFFEIIPEMNFAYSAYTGNLTNKVLSKNEEIILFEYLNPIQNGDNLNNIQAENINLIRENIGQYTLIIKYKDIYQIEMPTFSKDLNWLLRNFNN